MIPTKTLRISLVAWGKEHVRLANEVCLPSLLDPDVDVKLDVFTDIPSAFPFPTTRIESNPQNVHKLVSECHRISLSSLEPVVIVCPDMVFGAGVLKAIEGRRDKGKKLILVPAPRLDRPTVLPLLKERMSARELCAIAIEHLHSGLDLMFWDSDPFTTTPYQIYWKVDGGLVVRCFHMHPLMIWLEQKADFAGTVDGGCVDLFKTRDSCVITDSDEITCFEMSPPDHAWQSAGDRKDIVRWVNRKTNKMHQWFFTHECHVHTGVKESVVLPNELQQYA